MTKYARFLWRHNEVDQTIHMVDVIDTADYHPRPTWGQTDEELLSKLFEPNKAGWVADDEWFKQVPDGVQNGATFNGDEAADTMDATKYLNPDGTDGNGQ